MHIKILICKKKILLILKFQKFVLHIYLSLIRRWRNSENSIEKRENHQRIINNL